ncbi:AP-5 complex subunit mu-1 [Latimeria chalumnae]|uniref:AP-5 complex subunit mu-1 n=1 Tax=Latimeria chalumnae TaxID=7897 RepID=M3XHB4_LATCH|nr:PREDICTED: AP-5 complex subunit mu-1 [Latimeria chalumnae]|eukprot:XP_005986516.1 PREDICTED: AP-5 complex subunit mu-1 [Latimeria chalumnae]
MSIRALWLISHEKGESGAVRFSRRYPTVEKRARAFNGARYVDVPEDAFFLKALLLQLGLTDPDRNFVECRDDCSQINKTSVYEVPAGSGTIWPVLAIQQSGMIYACVPLVEQPLKPQPPLISISGVSQAFALLTGLVTFMNSSQKGETETLAKLAQIPQMLLQACPLGTLLDTNFVCLQTSCGSLAQQGLGSVTQKQPAWKPGVYKGKSQVNVCVTEQVTSMQYDKRDVADIWQVYGAVTCKCDLEGIMPNVTVSLNLPANGSPLQDILVHPCVGSLDSSILASSSIDESDDSVFSGPYKFPFSPPLDTFKLCYYTSQVPIPPILGFYQLKEEQRQQLKITVHLKLHESVKNGFEYCDAHIPFFNRGPITNIEYKISYGQLEVTREKGLLVWIIGQKFPKSLEISLTGTVTFGAGSVGQVQHPVDPLCTGLTAYVKLYFRTLDYTLTGCCVDQHSVQVYSAARPKIITSRELTSFEYYIWNSKGDAPVAYRSLTM